MKEYVVPAVPLGGTEEITAKRLLIANERPCEVERDGASESVTVTVKFAVPAAVGVPEMTPLTLKFNPAGKAPDVSDQETGAIPPVELSEALKGVPTAPDARTVVVMTSGGFTTIPPTIFAVCCGAEESLTCSPKP